MENTTGELNIECVCRYINDWIVREFAEQDCNSRVDLNIRLEGNSKVNITGSVAARSAFVNIQLQVLMALQKIGFDYGKRLDVKSSINYFEC